MAGKISFVGSEVDFVAAQKICCAVIPMKRRGLFPRNFGLFSSDASYIGVSLQTL